jgi:hypothetical protein
MLRASLLVLTSSFFSFTLGCGGNVSVDKSAPHGAGGGATSGTATDTQGGGGMGLSTATGTGTVTGTTGTGTVTGTTGTGTITGNLCEEICSVLVANGCQTGGGGLADCTNQCNGSLAKAGACAPQLVAVYECMKPFLAQCPKDTPAQCNDAVQAYATCSQNGGGGACGPATCGGSGGPGGAISCDCQQTCKGTPLEASCTTQNGQTSCNCSAGGSAVGSCSGPSSNDPCNLQSGCCAKAFAQYF